MQKVETFSTPSSALAAATWQLKYSNHEIWFLFSSVKNFTPRITYELTGSGNDFSVSHLLRTRTSSSKSVIVSVAVSKLDCIKLIFVEPGAKINGQY